MRTARSMLVAALAGLAIPIAIAGPAAAHETREVGDLTMTVGFGTEPAFENESNAASLSLSRGGEPVVEGVELEIEVAFGEEATTMALEPAFVVGAFGEPGLYEADFIPTRPGQYAFRFTGTIGGTEIDEEFTSGPDTFSDVNARAEASFPAADPSNAELAERLEQESARVRDLAAAAAADASAANTLALIALIVGGVAVAGVLLAVFGGLAIGGMAQRRARS